MPSSFFTTVINQSCVALESASGSGLASGGGVPVSILFQMAICCCWVKW